MHMGFQKLLCFIVQAIRQRFRKSNAKRIHITAISTVRNWSNIELRCLVHSNTYRKRSFQTVLFTLPIVITSLTVPFKCSHVSSKLTRFGFNDISRYLSFSVISSIIFFYRNLNSQANFLLIELNVMVQYLKGEIKIGIISVRQVCRTAKLPQLYARYFVCH